MALEYGFGLYEKEPVASDLWTRKYRALSDADKEFYNNALPFILMTVDIGEVTDETIPSIVSRYNFTNALGYREVCDFIRKCNGGTFQEYLQRFIGFRANVATTTKAEFVKKVIALCKLNVPELKKEALEEIRKNVSDLVLKEATKDDLPKLHQHTWKTEKAAVEYSRQYNNLPLSAPDNV